MIPIASGVRVWLAVGRNVYAARHEWPGSADPEALRRDPHAGDLYVFWSEAPEVT